MIGDPANPNSKSDLELQKKKQVVMNRISAIALELSQYLTPGGTIIVNIDSGKIKNLAGKSLVNPQGAIVLSRPVNYTAIETSLNG